MAELSRYRVLNAMLALREFTVADLAHYSDVKENTVRTVLNRDTHFVERDGNRSRGRRGGQPILYRLCPAAEDELVSILRKLDAFGAHLPPLAEDQEDPVMLSLKAAEDILLRRLPQAHTTADRAGLIHVATADYESVQFLAAIDQGEASTHRRVVDLLLQLAQVEQEVLSLAPPNTDPSGPDWPAQAVEMLCHESAKKIEDVGQQWHHLLKSWQAIRDTELLPDLVRRVATCWFAPAILCSKRAHPQPAADSQRTWRRYK